jgi:hypothetical protein
MPHPHRNRLHSMMMKRLVSSRVTKGSTSSCSSYHRSYSSSVACAAHKTRTHQQQISCDNPGTCLGEMWRITGCVQTCVRATPLEWVATLPVSETERPPSVGDFFQMPQSPPSPALRATLEMCGRPSLVVRDKLRPRVPSLHCHCLFAWTYRGTGLGHEEQKHDRDGQQDPLNHKERVHMAVAPIPARQQHARFRTSDYRSSSALTLRPHSFNFTGAGRMVQVLTTVPSCCRWC